MIKRMTHLFFAVILIFCIVSGPAALCAPDADTVYHPLTIATIESRPLSGDRLLFTAMRELGYHASFLPMQLEKGLSMVSVGAVDGVVLAVSDESRAYPGLVMIPVPLETVQLRAYIRQGSGIRVDGWSSLSGRTVGTNTQRTYSDSIFPADTTVIEGGNKSLILDDLAAGVSDVAVFAHRGNEDDIARDGIVFAGVLDELTDYLFLSESAADIAGSVERSLAAMFENGVAESILRDEYSQSVSGKRTILHIISSNREVERENMFSSVFRAQFDDDMSLEYYTLDLESRRFFTTTDRTSGVASILRQDFVSRDTAAIIVSGDDALRFIADYYSLLFRNVPVLFYGVCEDYREIIRGNEHNFSGIVDSVAAYETVSAALEMFPETENLYVLNDGTTEGAHYKAAIAEQLEPLSDRLNIEYSADTTCRSIISRISRLPDASIVLVGSYFVDSDGLYYPLDEMRRLLEANCTLPIFSFHSTVVEYNAIGGKALDFERSAEEIANMLKVLLEGGDIAEIPVVTDPARFNRWVFDKGMLDRFGLGKASLPSGSSIVNETVSIWESDPRFAAALLLLIIVGIVAAITATVILTRYRKQRELFLKDAEIRTVKERLERVINTAPLAYFTSIGGVIVETNEYLKRTLGAAEGDKSVRLYKKQEDRAVLVDKALTLDIVENHVVELNMPDGGTHRFYANVGATEYDDEKALIFWGMDIEDTLQKSDQLMRARQNLQDILDALPIAVRITGRRDGIVHYANRACLRLFGYGEDDEMVGRNIRSMLSNTELDLEVMPEDLAMLFKSDRQLEVEIEYRTLQGKPIETLVAACNIEYYGIDARVAIITDLAAEKEQQRMLERAAETEKEANQLKSRFLVNMSHEIRTPMNAIIGLTEIELRKKLVKETKDIYTKINISAKHLLEIINDILDLSKIEADKMELFDEEFELEEVLNSALLVAAPRLDGKCVEFMLDAALDIPRYVVGDRTRLWQVLKNFLDNSAKYTEKGRIVLRAAVDNDLSDDEVVSIHFAVEDTGIGISPDKLRNIFLPYEQVYNEAQKRYSGTGLGMAISKQLCELMGGVMDVESEPGVGTKIEITIPFKRSENRQSELSSIKTKALAGLNVLAVDDDILSLEIMQRLLRENDATCQVAHSGEEAIEIVLHRRDKGDSFDAILLDYMMDGIDGLETARRINMSLSTAPKLLMVTAYQKLLVRSELERNGIKDVIEKPFIPSQFVGKLCSALGLTEDDGGSQESFEQYPGVHVLLCEDYLLNQEVARGMLSQFGITATVADNGKEGVELLKSGKAFDLVFMDLQMPVMDGYEATRVIREDPAFDDLPIISLTADAMKEIVDKCLETGMNGHVAKPIEFDSLRRVLRTWLPESKREGANLSAKAPDSADALSRFGGDKARYDAALSEFKRELPEQWPSERDELLRLVHKIRGAAGNLSLGGIFDAAGALEEALHDGSDTERHLAAFADACRDAKESGAHE